MRPHTNVKLTGQTLLHIKKIFNRNTCKYVYLVTIGANCLPDLLVATLFQNHVTQDDSHTPHSQQDPKNTVGQMGGALTLTLNIPMYYLHTNIHVRGCTHLHLLYHKRCPYDFTTEILTYTGGLGLGPQWRVSHNHQVSLVK